jgi:toxin-antitoxin system PIN domain toxin
MPDVPVLVYAHRAEDPSHEAARHWMEALASGPEPFALSVLTAAGFVRVVSNPGIFANPTPVPVALAAVEALVSAPGCRVLAPGPGHLTLFLRLCRETGASAKLAADAQHAALAIEHGCEWVSYDRDFAKFTRSGLRFRLLAR